GALGGGQPGIDIPVADDEAEMIERHLGEAVNPGLVRTRLLAAVVDRQDLALDRLGVRLLAERLRPCRRRERQEANDEQQRCGKGEAASGTHDLPQQARQSRPTDVNNATGAAAAAAKRTNIQNMRAVLLPGGWSYMRSA